VDVDLVVRDGIDPSAENAAAWKRQGMRTVFIDDRKFEFPVERGGQNGFPLHAYSLRRTRRACFDLHQARRLGPDPGYPA
jgi:hypothetical protein